MTAVRRELIAVGAAGLLGLALAWQAPGPISVDIGKPDEIFLTNFESPETVAGRDYRWSTHDSNIHFPGIGVGDWRVTLVAAAGSRPQPVPLTILAGGDPVLQVPAADPGFHTYSFVVPARDMPVGDMSLDLGIAAYRPPGENRDLGLAVDQVRLEPAVPLAPAPLAWLLLVAGLTAFYATGRLYWGARAVAVATALAGLLLAVTVAWARLSVTPYASYLPMIGGLFFAGLYTLRATLRNSAKEVNLLPALFVGYALFSMAAQVVFLARKPLPDDFVAFYRASGRLLAHQPLYDLAQLLRNPLDAGYKYPPLFAQILTPVAGLPMRTALGVWNLANLCFLGMALYAIMRAHGKRPADAAPAGLALVALALLFQPAVDTLIAGQMDLSILGLVALAYWALRAGRPVLAGLPLAVAVLFKLYPGLLLVFLLMRREWRALWSCLAAMAALVAASILFVGPDPWWSFLTVGLPHNGGPSAWIENQNFSGFLGRLLTERIDLEPFPADPAWKAQVVAVGTLLWATLLLAAVIWAAWKPAARRSTAYALGFAAFTAACVMALPNAWYHYMTLLLLPLGIAFFALEEAGGRWWAEARRPLSGALAALGTGAVLLAFGTYQVVWNGINLGGPWKLGLSYKFYGSVLLLASLLWMLRQAVGQGEQGEDTVGP
ncbi:MAG: glycosyltransferase family 87 protein [Chloroflexia bacterium]